MLDHIITLFSQRFSLIFTYKTYLPWKTYCILPRTECVGITKSSKVQTSNMSWGSIYDLNILTLNFVFPYRILLFLSVLQIFSTELFLWWLLYLKKCNNTFCDQFLILFYNENNLWNFEISVSTVIIFYSS